MNHDSFIVLPSSKTSSSKDYDPEYGGKYQKKEDIADKLQRDVERLSTYRDILYANNRYAALLIFQALDAVGKDSTMKHVTSGINPRGCRVLSFKAPSDEELDHDCLWRSCRALPERGRIGIFNRSYYEEVLVERAESGKGIWVSSSR
ncbi:hypothetical protein [Phormidesmis priestleyi]|uniref:hypothetical protein n=1 Tax=Phormidesmis priestleyi TaxID=268141 RepID=UPI0009EE8273|nr:hypothetical protein [Phormidesmis priestleyi]